MLTCSIGYPHHHHHPRPYEPGRQPSITTSHSACFHLYSAPHLCRRRRGEVVNTLPGAAVLRSHCHGKAITGAAGERCTPPGQPRYPAALVHTHLHQINACPLILAGPFITFFSASVQPQNRSPANREARQHRILPPLLVALSGEKTHEPPRRQRRAARYSTVNDGKPLPFDSTLSPNRSSRQSQAPTALQNTTTSSISSAWLPSLFFPLFSFALLVCVAGSALLVAARPGWLCPSRELRRAAPAGFVSRSGGSGGREQEAASQHRRG